ncbi:hypothetical protein IJ847_01955 [Candidatus Saccharibacteria bacterium]|nr:hypothetical protein [Candidatus Saccharibacteria bacterium]
MKKFLAKVFGFLMAAALCFLAVGLAFADEGRLSLSVGELDFGVLQDGGHSYTRDLVLTNNSGETLAVDLSVENYSDDSLDNQWKAASEWLVFVDARNHFEIAPGESATAGVRLMVPNEVAGGSYYAKIVAKTDAGEKSVGVVADLATEGYKKSGELVKNSIPPFVILTDGSNGICDAARAEVKNTGTAQIAATYSLVERNSFGLSDEREATKASKSIRQGESASLVADECVAEKKGFVNVVQKISYINAEGKEVTAVLERNVIVLPLMAVIGICVGIVAVIALVVVIVKIRTRKILKKQKAEDEL